TASDIPRTACRDRCASAADPARAPGARARRRTGHSENAWGLMVPHAASGAAPRSMGTRAGESPEAGVAIRGVARISGMALPLPMREGARACRAPRIEEAVLFRRALVTRVFTLRRAAAVSAAVV